MKKQLVSTLTVLSLITCGCARRTEHKADLSDLKHTLIQQQIAEMIKKHPRAEPAESEAQQPAIVAWADLEKVNRGTKKEDVLQILGKPVLRTTNFEVQPTCDILYYYTSHNASSQVLEGGEHVSTRKRLAPVVILDDEVVGRGWAFLDAYRQEHPDVWMAEWDGAIEVISRARPDTRE